MMTIKRRTSLGRRKIEIKKIEKEEACQVTFSKRRAGLFKKANELCTLCGAETAVIVFSPAGKCFSYGHPSVDSIVDDFLAGNRRPPVTEADVRRRNCGHVRELHKQHAEVVNQLDAEKSKGEEFEKKLRQESRNNFWWEVPIDELGLPELKQLKAAMEDLKNRVINRSDEIKINSVPLTSFLTSAATNPIGGMTSINHYGYSSFGSSMPNPNHQSTIVGMTNTNHHHGYSSVGMTSTNPYHGYSSSGPPRPNLNHQSTSVVPHYGQSALEPNPDPIPNPNLNLLGTSVVPNNHGYGGFGPSGYNRGGGRGAY